MTLVLVTHDPEEAMADRELVLPKDLEAGQRLIEVDIPRPRNRSEGRFVAMQRRWMAVFELH